MNDEAKSTVLNPGNLHGFFAACRFYDYWMFMGWADVVRGYSRMKLGVLWVPASQAIFISVLGVLYAMILNYSAESYIPYLSGGIITWNLIRSVIMESGRCYISNSRLLLNSAISPYVLVLRMVWRNHLIFALTLSVHLAILLIFQIHWSWEILLFPIGVAYIFLNSIWVGLTLAHFATRYRDLLQLVSNIMQPMFFITPILWGHDKLAAKAVVFSEWNPFYNFIELVRAPLLMTAPEPFSYMYVSVITLVGLTFAVWLIRHSGRSVVFWL